MDLVAADFNGCAQYGRRVAMAVRAQFVDVGPVGQFPNGCAHGRLRSGKNTLGQFLQDALRVICDELQEPLPPDSCRPDDRLDIAENHFRCPNIGSHHSVQLSVAASALMQLARQYA